MSNSLGDSISSSSDSKNRLDSVTSINGSSDCGGSTTSLSKKNVHFNKQVVKNVFKQGSTIAGMKKPNSAKNKKKNKRKRTISDPSHDASNDAYRRSRGISESSDDQGMVNTKDEEEKQLTIDENSKIVNQEEVSSKSSRKKNRKKKRNCKSESDNEIAPSKQQLLSQQQQQQQQQKQEDKKKPMDLEKMINMRNEGTLPSSSNYDEHKTSCGVKFKNKIINELDD
jgi:hypothetical protein